ncbi:MAG: MFS transporter [Solirubrobacteraceae bacterium]
MRLPSDLEVLRLRDFRLVYGAELASLIGDGVVPVALAFAVLDLTGSATDLGVVLACRAVALLGSLLAGGVVGDRLGRRGVMIAADLTRLVGQGAIGLLLVTGDATVAELAVSQALLGAATGFFVPASSGLLPSVAGPHLRKANALFGITGAASNIVGPAIAGVLVVAAGPGAALLIDAGSYAASALLLAQVGHVAGARTATEGPQRFLSDLRYGFAEVRSRTWLWSGLLVLSLINLVASAFPVLGPLVAKQHLGGPGAWAAILTARAIGALLGGTALLRISPRRPLLMGTLACAMTAVPTMLLAIPAPLTVLVVVTLAAGIGPMVFNTLWQTTVLQYVPEHVRSRVTSYDWFGSLALAPLGLALVGPLASAIGTSAALYACGAIEWMLAASLLLVRDVRTLPPGPEPPEPRHDAPSASAT